MQKAKWTQESTVSPGCCYGSQCGPFADKLVRARASGPSGQGGEGGPLGAPVGPREDRGRLHCPVQSIPWGAPAESRAASPR